jgi:hypothetical protein
MRAMQICAVVIAGALLVLSTVFGEGQDQARKAPAADDTLLSIETAITLAKDAIAEDPRFEGMFVTGARLMLASERNPVLEKDLPANVRSLWRVDLSEHYPYPPGTRYFVEVTHQGATFPRSLGR